MGTNDSNLTVTVLIHENFMRQRGVASSSVGGPRLVLQTSATPLPANK